MKYLKMFLLLVFALSMIFMMSCNKTKNSANSKFVWPSDTEDGFIKVAGGTIPYKLFGKGKKGTPIIMVNGGPGSSFEKFYTLLALAEDRPVVFYNQLGSAGTSYDDDYKTLNDIHKLMTVEHYVEELQNVVDYFGFDKFILYGQSWGTMLSIEYTLAKKPANLEKIILSGPFLSVSRWINDAERLIKSLPDGESKWDYVKQCIEMSKDNKNIFKTDKKYNEINDEYTRTFGTRNVARLKEIPDHKPLPQVYDEINGKMVDADLYNYMWGPSEFTCNGTLQGHDVTSRLKEINTPILYISGEYDSGTPETANYYNSLTPNGRVVVIKNAGHSSYFDNTEDVLSAVKGFID